MFERKSSSSELTKREKERFWLQRENYVIFAAELRGGRRIVGRNCSLRFAEQIWSIQWKQEKSLNLFRLDQTAINVVAAALVVVVVLVMIVVVVVVADQVMSQARAGSRNKAIEYSASYHYCHILGLGLE